jgi:predicted Zn-dependent protease
MHYENRQPPEGINISHEHPFKQFLKLLIAAAVLIVLLVAVLHFSGAWLAKRVPFSVETRLMQKINVPFSEADASPGMVAYLNELATRVSANLPLPDGMSVRVHYNAEDVFNAFATIGGNLVFYRDLLQRMPHENALAMVMAHEISHVMHRDPIAGLGGGLASMTAMLLMTGNAGTNAASGVLSRAGAVTAMQFTRGMETAADTAALRAMVGTYGHVNGADTLFKLIREEHGDGKLPEWLQRFASTHPLDDDRISRIAAQAKANEWPTGGELTPLPDDFQAWLASGKEE